MSNTTSENNKTRVIRTSIIYIVVTVLLVIILCRVLYIQIALHDRELEKQKKRIVQERTYQAKRGNIYSIDYDTGEYLMLATDVPIYDMYIDLGKQKDKKTEKKEWVIPDSIFRKDLKPMCDSLAKIFAHKKDGKTSAEYQQYFLSFRNKEKNRGVPVARDITYEELQRLKTFPIIGRAIKDKKDTTKVFYRLSHRVHVAEKGKRVYPYYPLARRTIGIKLTGDCDTCYNGIDGGFDKYLRGEKGHRLERKINPGVWVPYNKDEKITAKNGYDVVTSIDVSLQELAESSLMNCLQTNEAESGCVILMEVETGFVRAIASFTDIKGTYFENNNIAISGSFEPGSTFKTVTAMMMLDKGLATLSDSVPTGAKLFPGNEKPIKDVGEINRGNISFERALEISSNVGISQLVFDVYGATAAKRKKFQEDLMQYFPCERLGLDIDVHEPKPIIRSSENPSDLLRMSFGYVTQMTPLQMLTFYNAIANNGKMVKPQFVTEVLRDGIVEKVFEPIVIKDSICKRSTRDSIHRVLKGVVNNGTGRRLKGASYGIAGKSGTAEINYDEKGVIKKLHRASFVGYFPADEPKYSCIVLIINPKGSKTHGGDLAAPVFRDLSDRVVGTRIGLSKIGNTTEKKIPIMKFGNTASYEALCQSLGFDVNFPSSQWLKVREIKDSLEFIPYNINKDVVPNVIGLTIKDALYMLENLGMQVRFKGKGKVISQSIAAGSKITDEVIVLELGINNSKK